MRAGNGKQKVFLEEKLGLQVIVVDGKSEDRGIEIAASEAREERVTFFLDQQRLEPRNCLWMRGTA